MPTITPEPESRLAQLVAQYDLSLAERDKAKEAHDAIVAGIKSELANAAPGESSVDVASPELTQPLRLIAVESWRVDSKLLKDREPETYVRYAKQSTSWTLKRVTS